MKYTRIFCLLILAYGLCILQTEAQQKLRTVPTFENCSYYCDSVFDVSFDKAWNTGNTFRIMYKAEGQSEWKQALPPYYDKERFQIRGSIMSLKEGTSYEVRLEKMRRDKWSVLKKSTFETWSSNPPVDKTLKLSEMKEYKPGQGVVLSGLKGNKKGWIKIVGDVPVDASKSYRQALEINNCEYLILENFNIKGGKIDGVAIRENCKDVRIVGADISAWGRIAVDQVHLEDSINYPASIYKRDNACFIDDEGVVIRNDAGVYLGTVGKNPGPENIVIERCYIHDPNGNSNPWYGTRTIGKAKGIPYRFWHPQGPQGVYMRSNGGLVIRYNDIVGSDHHRLNDLLGGFNNGKIDGGINTDGDIYGNFLAYSQDDGLELDGGQCNVRLYGNRIEQARVGVSTAPNVKGPSYLFNNVIFNLGDENREYSYGIKNGGGTMYSHGLHYFLNNTFYISGNCISSVGYGSDANKGMYQGYSRNNILVNRKENNPKARGCGIYEAHSHTTNHFDYDLFCDENKKDKKGQARLQSTGCEEHGVYGDPLFIRPEAGIFTLSSGSPAIGSGEILPNISEPKNGKTDMGAIGYGESSLIPQRPLQIESDRYFVQIDKKAAGSVKLKDGKLPSALSYTINKSEDMDWFSIENSSGKISAGETVEIRFSTQVQEEKSYKGTFYVRFSNGFSIPVSIEIL